jgi:hypothetical protein
MKHCECTSPICDCRKEHRLQRGEQCPNPAVAKVGLSLLCRVCTNFAEGLGLKSVALE